MAVLAHKKTPHSRSLPLLMHKVVWAQIPAWPEVVNADPV